jgi:glycosyltransferase involved in cell wall biosynthesis
MRIALYHDLPAGGALRFARDSVASTNREHSYVLFLDDAAVVDPVLARAVDEVRRVPVSSFAAAGPGRVGHLRRMLAGQEAIAAAIDGGRFDLALFHPSQVTQAPVALAYLGSTPSLYFAQEPRRRAYERGYQPWIESRHGARKVVAGWARVAQERWLTRLDRDAVDCAGVVATNSSFSVESIARAYGRDAVLCHLGVPIGDRPLAPRVAVRSLLSVGALDPTKGHDLVVEALGLLPRSTRPSLTVVHERVDLRFRAVLEERARDLDVALTIRSDVPDAELTTLDGSATATVAAARLEPFGLTPLESMAVGTPVLAAREGGYRETVTHGVNGILVDRNAAALAAGVDQVLELADLVEPETIRKSVQPHWTWERCMDDFRALLERAATR